MGKQAFKYVLICMATYLGISGIEILLKPLINLIDTGFWHQLIIYSILLIVVNPIVTRILSNKYLKHVNDQNYI